MPAFSLSPTEDEHVYSLVAAYRAVLGLRYGVDLFREAFGSTTGAKEMLFPDNLGRFAASYMAPYRDVARVVQELTPYPYFQRFLAREERDKLFDGMVARREPLDIMIVPVELRQAAPPRRLRMCPTCAADSLTSRPVASWRRVHQLPGVFVCPDHDRRLCASEIQTDHMEWLELGPRFPMWIHPIWTTIPPEMARSLARNTAWLLRNPGPSLDPRALGEAVSQMLGEAEWTPGPGGTQGAARDAFEHMLEEIRDKEARRELDLNDYPGRQPGWVAKLFNPKAETILHPVRYLLLMAFLRRDVRDLVAAAEAIAQQRYAEP